MRTPGGFSELRLTMLEKQTYLYRYVGVRARRVGILLQDGLIETLQHAWNGSFHELIMSLSRVERDKR